tara:strand:- start:51 stop:1319 length:1269 start_codon:yes stop_codon:yes gene_type:complete
MELEIKENKFLFFLFLIIPISLIVGSSISLINIILIELGFIYYFYLNKNSFFIKKNTIYLLFLIQIYLVFNSFISINYEIGLSRNLGFFRFIILFVFINFLFHKNYNISKLLHFWAFIILLIILDIYVEFYSGSNVFGWGKIEIDGVKQPHAKRIMSFFKDEPIAGAYVSAFILLISGFLLNYYKKKRYIPLLFILFAFLAILLTGERSNTIKSLIGILFLFISLDFLKLRTKVISLIAFFILVFLILSQSTYLKARYYGQFLYNFSSIERYEKFLERSLYFQLYKSGFEVFKNYPIFGVGNKNYRIETCKSVTEQRKYGYKCLTHPHQIYIELLSEHGLFGSIIILGIFFILIFKIIKNVLLSRNYLQIGSLIFVVLTFIPILPGGSFFGDFNMNLFWLNFSIMFACCERTNIFTDIKRNN